MARKITCRNNDNMSVEFSENDFTPLLLESCDGIYLGENNVSGRCYQNAKYRTDIKR